MGEWGEVNGMPSFNLIKSTLPLAHLKPFAPPVSDAPVVNNKESQAGSGLPDSTIGPK